MPCLYQLDLVTPVISPLEASLRKHSLQIPNLRKYALERPHKGQRLYARTENFGALSALAMSDFFATDPSYVRYSVILVLFFPKRHANLA